MSDQPQYLTAEGLRELEEKLAYLRNVRRPAVAERLHQALSEGGELTENAEYDDAKNEQSFLEGEILRLENILSNAQIIEENEDAPQGIVKLGGRVTIQEKGKRTQETFQIVGQAEANPREGKISNESPLGKALIGRKLGDKVTVKAPDGDIVYTIKAINK